MEQDYPSQNINDYKTFSFKPLVHSPGSRMKLTIFSGSPGLFIRTKTWGAAPDNCTTNVARVRVSRGVLPKRLMLRSGPSWRSWLKIRKSAKVNFLLEAS